MIASFVHDGYAVVPGVLTAAEVAVARGALHRTVGELTGKTHAEHLASPLAIAAAKKSPVAAITAPQWKMSVHLHPGVVAAYDALYAGTYGADGGGPEALFTHGLGPAGPSALGLIDRVGYRLPGHPGLGMHVDRNPLDPLLSRAGGLPYWRPIQAVVCLTDHVDHQSGGLRVVPGFHRRDAAYFAGNAEAQEAVGSRGQFFRLSGRAHDRLRRSLQTVVAPAGSVVLWDNRLAHATTETLRPGDSRDVVYAGFLPDVPLNRRYCREVQWPTIAAAPDRDWAPDAVTRARFAM